MFHDTPFLKAATLGYAATSFALQFHASSFAPSFVLRILLLSNTLAVERLLGTRRLATVSLLTTAAASLVTRDPFMAFATTLMLLFNTLVPWIIPLDSKTLPNLLCLHLFLTHPQRSVFNLAVSVAAPLAYFSLPAAIKDWRLPESAFQLLNWINTPDTRLHSDSVHDGAPENARRSATAQPRPPVVEIPISEEHVTNLMDLGFSRDQVEQALRVSNNVFLKLINQIGSQ
ncbi:MAG: hypothetical protein SGCHY_001467 [Lobulomycetales sp.]